MTTPWLSDEEIAELCEPLEQPAAQIRYLKKRGYYVTTKPNGRPVLMRSELERVAGPARLTAAAQNASAGPNVIGLQQWANGRRPHGTKAQGR